MSGPGSLAALFSPPDGHRGHAGWIVGFSADAPFLELAADRFTGASKGQRALAGRTHLCLLLDPSAPQVPIGAVPGVLHLPARRLPLPFALLHAKVALLLFTSDKSWVLRLGVSTGNWTRQTLEDSLDLVWRLDLSQADLRGAEAEPAVADLRAAADLLSWLRPLFSDDALRLAKGAAVAQARAAFDQLDALLVRLPASAATPRFLDSRTTPLVEGVSARAASLAGTHKRNLLVAGSGFWGGGEHAGLPVAAERIVRRLQSGVEPLLSRSAAVHLVVEPAACQEVARARGALAAAGWQVRAARDPEGDRGGLRTLHAKLLFSAAERNSGNLLHPWLHLGSGNLTDPGFLRAASRGGNLEAGVVQPLSRTRRCDLPGVLPFDLDSTDLVRANLPLAPGGPAPERSPELVAPPFPFLEAEDGVLRLPEGLPDGGASVLDAAGGSLPRDAQGRWPWPGPPPAEVRVRWTESDAQRQAWVPVLDAFGRLGGRQLPPLAFDQLEDELRSFPDAPEVDDEEEEEDGVGDGQAAAGAGGGSPEARYPIRSLMQAIELVAARQSELPPGQAPAWCARLEQAMVRLEAAPEVRALPALGLNPLAVLRRPEFRPPFDEAGLALYEASLEKIERAWKIETLPPLGGTP
ncbi:MAG: hypothetical protein JW751_00070 [Polyangiaceae bacterium]|nr:hypothetical protein [Polyangiaceae bacterium]